VKLVLRKKLVRREAECRGAAGSYGTAVPAKAGGWPVRVPFLFAEVRKENLASERSYCSAAAPAARVAARPRRLASLVLVAGASALALLPAAGAAGQALALTSAHARSRSACRVPGLVGLERSPAEGELEPNTTTACGRLLRRGHLTILDPHRRGPLRVISQSPRAGIPVARRTQVNLTLEPSPPLPKSCRAPTSYKVLVHTPQLVVWEISRAHHEGATIETYYACSPPNGAKRAIGRTVTEGEEYSSSLVDLTAAGPYVGLIEEFGSKGGSSETLTVQDARSGETFTIRVSDHPSDYAAGAEPQIEELQELGNPVGEGANPYILNANGDVAWIGQTEPTPGQPRQDVLYLHEPQETREVAAAPEITDLAFSGRSLTWRSAGVRQSTPA
jgi:hypothetical protein